MLKDLDITTGKASLYIGKGAGKRIVNTFARAKKSIYIISPYITTDYIDLLSRKYASGIDVKLITSSKSYNMIAIKKIIKRRKLKGKYFYDLKFPFKVVLSPYDNIKNTNEYLLHAKVYSIDGIKAYIGSMNMSRASFNNHYESRIRIDNEQAVSKIDADFNYLWQNSNTKYQSVKEVITHIYKC